MPAPVFRRKRQTPFELSHPLFVERLYSAKMLVTYGQSIIQARHWSRLSDLARCSIMISRAGTALTCSGRREEGMSCRRQPDKLLSLAAEELSPAAGAPISVPKAILAGIAHDVVAAQEFAFYCLDSSGEPRQAIALLRKPIPMMKCAVALHLMTANKGESHEGADRYHIPRPTG